MNKLDDNFKYEPRLKKFFRETVFPTLKERWGYKNDLAVPRIESVVVTCILGEMAKDEAIMNSAREDMRLITGQKPASVLVKKSEQAFKTRTGMKLGYKVTLRGNGMYDFLDRLINAALPQQRNFSGLSSRSFDGRGNFSLGFRALSVFPEIDYRKIDVGCGITIITNAKKDDEAQELLELTGFPFNKQERKLEKFGQDYYQPQDENFVAGVIDGTIKNKPNKKQQNLEQTKEEKKAKRALLKTTIKEKELTNEKKQKNVGERNVK